MSLYSVDRFAARFQVANFPSRPYRPPRDIENGWVKIGENGLFIYEGTKQFISTQGGGTPSLSDAINVAEFFFDKYFIAIEEDREIVEVIEF